MFYSVNATFGKKEFFFNLCLKFRSSKFSVWIKFNFIKQILETPRKLDRGVRPTFQNPYPIYDQNLLFSLPYLWPDKLK